MATERKVALVRISFELLSDLLKLPPDVDITDLFLDSDVLGRTTFFARLTGKGLPSECKPELDCMIRKVKLEYEHSSAPAKIVPHM